MKYKLFYFAYGQPYEHGNGFTNIEVARKAANTYIKSFPEVHLCVIIGIDEPSYYEVIAKDETK